MTDHVDIQPVAAVDGDERYLVYEPDAPENQRSQYVLGTTLQAWLESVLSGIGDVSILENGVEVLGAATAINFVGFSDVSNDGGGQVTVTPNSAEYPLSGAAYISSGPQSLSVDTLTTNLIAPSNWTGGTLTLTTSAGVPDQCQFWVRCSASIGMTITGNAIETYWQGVRLYGGEAILFSKRGANPDLTVVCRIDVGMDEVTVTGNLTLTTDHIDTVLRSDDTAEHVITVPKSIWSTIGGTRKLEVMAGPLHDIPIVGYTQADYESLIGMPGAFGENRVRRRGRAVIRAGLDQVPRVTGNLVEGPSLESTISWERYTQVVDDVTGRVFSWGGLPVARPYMERADDGSTIVYGGTSGTESVSYVESADYGIPYDAFAIGITFTWPPPWSSGKALIGLFDDAAGYGVALDLSGGSVRTGYWQGPGTFLPPTVVQIPTSISEPITFVARADAAAKAIWWMVDVGDVSGVLLVPGMASWAGGIATGANLRLGGWGEWNYYTPLWIHGAEFWEDATGWTADTMHRALRRVQRHRPSGGR